MIRLGSFRELTQLGCVGGSDSFAVPGIGTSIGSTPVYGPGGLPTVCLAPNISR
ncbi:MAG: hypothetical protein IT359_16935 [Gemmatimonadaceae bacterium]|nr:hypothetical protein [Gemmatimonadaceae bacterium]